MVGALAVAEHAREAGLTARVGGVTWERRPIDPLPGPRRLEEIDGAERLGSTAAALAGPQTRGPGGFRFAESHMAAVLGEGVLLIDPNGGPAAIAAGLDAAAAALACDLIVLADVGGDLLGHGDEPGLASPLCDALLLAAGAHLRTPAVAAVFGTGCDGELRPEEVLERVAEVAAAGGWLGTASPSPRALERLQAALTQVPTEASAQAVACARGAFGEAPIRQGRRSVPLSPLGALIFFLDVQACLRSAARLAAAVVDAQSLQEAEAVLAARGIRTELAYEIDAAAS